MTGPKRFWVEQDENPTLLHSEALLLIIPVLPLCLEPCCSAKQDGRELVSPTVLTLSQLLNIWWSLERMDIQIVSKIHKCSNEDHIFYGLFIPSYFTQNRMFAEAFFIWICWEGTRESNLQWKSNILLKPDTITISPKHKWEYKKHTFGPSGPANPLCPWFPLLPFLPSSPWQNNYKNTVVWTNPPCSDNNPIRTMFSTNTDFQAMYPKSSSVCTRFADVLEQTGWLQNCSVFTTYSIWFDVF